MHKLLSRVSSGAFAAVVALMAGACLAVFVAILSNLLRVGGNAISLELIFASPSDAGRSGGVAPILVSTGLIVAVCVAAVAPVGLVAGLFLAEFTSSRSPIARAVSFSLDVLAGIPSVVFGLFGLAFFCRFLGLGFSILAGGLTLACMILPTVVRTVEQGLRRVPADLRAGATALGLSPLAVAVRVTIPIAVPTIAVALALGCSRAVSETAVLMFTSGYVDRMPTSLLDSGRALSIHILDLSMNVPGGDSRACASAVLLLAVSLLLNLSVAALSDRWMSKTGRIQA